MVEKQASFAGWRTTTRLADSWARVWQPLGGRRSWFCLKSPGRNRRISSLFTISRNSDGSGYRYLRRDRQIEGKGGRDPMMSSGSKIKHNPKPRRIGSLSCPGMSFPGMLVVVLVLVAFPQRSQAAVDAPSVQRAIDRGIAYLRKTQNQRGGWTEFSGQSCGLSALCSLALLNAGVAKDDPDMVRAMRYLREFEPNETYSVSLQTLVYCQLGAAGDLPRIRRNVDWLVASQKKGDPIRDRGGSWDYGSGRGSGDPSNTQFALLALGAARDRGIEIDAEVFRRSLDYWLPRQRNGGWSYGNNRKLSGSMTCAGIASTIIARSNLGDSEAEGNQIRCCGADQAGPDPVEEGLRWLGGNFTLQVNPGGDSLTLFYYLYALERVGRLSGRRFIGDHDWYREGAERLLALQDEFVGFWAGSGVMEENRDVATSFALLFLSKGKRQVVVGRIEVQRSPVPSRLATTPRLAPATGAPCRAGLGSRFDLANHRRR